MRSHPGRSFLVVGLGLFAQLSLASAQDMTINLNPSVIAETPCRELFGGVDFAQNDINQAVKSAAEGGYRFGYAMGYLNGVLDDEGKKRPLGEDELEIFFGTYKLLCDNNEELSIYEAARDAMSFQTR